MIARWTCEAKFGHKNEALALHKEWEEQIGSQTDIDDVRFFEIDDGGNDDVAFLRGRAWRNSIRGRHRTP